MTNTRLVFSIVSLFVLAACAAPPAPTGSATVAATRTPRPPTATATAFPATPTSPPVAPLTAHEWQPEEILVKFGFTGLPEGYPILDPITVYADGHVITTGYFGEDNIQVREGWLSRGEVCQLLNTIDQTGFFDYNHRIYEHYGVSFWAYIIVSSWDSNEISPIEGPPCVGCGSQIHLPAFVNSYRLLDSFEPQNLQALANPQTLLLIEESRTPSDLTISVSHPWPEYLPSLAMKTDSYSCTGWANLTTLVVDQDLFFEFISDFELTYAGGVFVENGRYFSISYRPVFPDEIIPVCAEYAVFDNPTVHIDVPDTLSCSPEDGVLPIPEPTPQPTTTP